MVNVEGLNPNIGLDAKAVTDALRRVASSQNPNTRLELHGYYGGLYLFGYVDREEAREILAKPESCSPIFFNVSLDVIPESQEDGEPAWEAFSQDSARGFLTEFFEVTDDPDAWEKAMETHRARQQKIKDSPTIELSPPQRPALPPHFRKRGPAR
jgi:hypothetical protein